MEAGDEITLWSHQITILAWSGRQVEHVVVTGGDDVWIDFIRPATGIKGAARREHEGVWWVYGHHEMTSEVIETLVFTDRLLYPQERPK